MISRSNIVLGLILIGSFPAVAGAQSLRMDKNASVEQLVAVDSSEDLVIAEEFINLLGPTEQTCVCSCIGKNAEGKDKTLCSNKGAHNDDSNACEANFNAGLPDATKGEKTCSDKNTKKCPGYPPTDSDQTPMEEGKWASCHDAFWPKKSDTKAD